MLKILEGRCEILEIQIVLFLAEYLAVFSPEMNVHRNSDFGPKANIRSNSTCICKSKFLNFHKFSPIHFHQYIYHLRHILAVSLFKSHSVSDVITSISSLVFHNKSYSVPSIVLEIYFLKDFVTVSTFPLSYYFIHTWHSMYSFLFIIELFTIHQTVFLFYAIFQVIIPSFK